MIPARRRRRLNGPRLLGWGPAPCFFFPVNAPFSLGRGRRHLRLPPCITRQSFANRLGTWNVRGINGTTRKEEVVDVFRKGKFELLALTETILKGNGDVSWYGVNALRVFSRWKELWQVWPSCRTMCGTLW